MHANTDQFFYRLFFLQKMQLAIALYNNDVDDEDELEFRKGDVLTVLIENPNGLNGWWLCEYKGKCGLCPGNRLKLISNIVSKSNEPIRASSCLSTASVSLNKTIIIFIMTIFFVQLDV
jgi:enhancer-of-filamentation protein 1